MKRDQLARDTFDATLSSNWEEYIQKQLETYDAPNSKVRCQYEFESQYELGVRDYSRFYERPSFEEFGVEGRTSPLPRYYDVPQKRFGEKNDSERESDSEDAKVMNSDLPSARMSSFLGRLQKKVQNLWGEILGLFAQQSLQLKENDDLSMREGLLNSQPGEVGTKEWEYSEYHWPDAV